jgi:hypothetical protein
MKKRYLLTLFVVVLVALASVTPALAYNGIKGTVIDSKNKEPWVHGGDVHLVNASGTTVATCKLNSVGEIVDGTPGNGETECNYGDNYLEVASFDGTAVGNDMTLIIDFECVLSPETCEPPAGYPESPNLTFDDYAGLPETLYNFSWIETGTGPNAVSLAGLSGTSGLALMGVLPLAAVAGLGAVKLNRKKQQ